MIARSALLLVLIASAAPAAPRKSIEPSEVREVTQQFATCTVRKHAQRAVQLVLDPSTYLERRDYLKLFDPGCVPTIGRDRKIIAASNQNMRFALAEALVRSEYPSASMADVMLAPPLDHSPARRPVSASAKSPTPEMLAEWDKARAANEAISMLGECVVRANPVAAHGLLLTDPGSAMEQRYFDTLQPIAASCIERGASVSLTKYSLRGTIALNFYRLAKAPRAAVAAQ